MNAVHPAAHPQTFPGDAENSVQAGIMLEQALPFVHTAGLWCFLEGEWEES
jgi:hypothetical protein